MGIVQASLFDGKVCVRCGHWKPFNAFHKNAQIRDGFHTYCKICRQPYAKMISEAAKERQRISHRNYHIRHRDAILARAAAARKGKSRYEYYVRTKQAHDARSREYARQHPEIRRLASMRYNARKRGAHGRFTVQEWLLLCDKYGNKCLCCGKSTKLTADHVVPISKGGDNTIDNIQPLCQPCNSSKGARTIDYRT